MSTVQSFKDMIVEKFKLDSEKEAIEETLKAKNKQLVELNSKITESLIAEGLEDFHVPEIGKVYLVSKYNWKLPDGDEKLAFHSYLKENNQEDMLSVNHQTFNSFCRKQLEEAQARGELTFTVPGVGEPTVFQTINKRKA